MSAHGFCPRCGRQLAPVGLHWLQARKRADGYPEEHVHLACLCGYQTCCVVTPGSVPSSFYAHAVGAEIALARMLGYDARYANDDPPGVVRGYEVRWADWPEAELPVHDADADDAVFVLVTGKLPTFRVHGWVLGGEAKVRRYQRPTNPMDSPPGAQA